VRRVPIWPRSLAGRTLALLRATALIVYLGGIFVYRVLAEDAAERSRVVQVTDRLRRTIDVLADLAERDRPAAMETLSSPDFRVTWSGVPLVADASATDPRLGGLRKRFLQLAPELGRPGRKHGPACDNLRKAEMALADRRTVTASARENPDLFWAIMGGGSVAIFPGGNTL
jgi:hypothetical protein